MLEQKKHELQVLSDELNSLIEEKENAIALQSLEVNEKDQQITALKAAIESLEGQLESLKKTLQDTIITMQSNDANFDKRYAEQTAAYETKLSKEIEAIKLEHVREMQIMLQDFEKAKAFLKREISNQAKR